MRDRFVKLGPSVSPSDAARLASAAIEQSAALGREYRAVRPAWINNIMVNRGRRERGLCYQWTNDLYPRLSEVRADSLELHLGVSRIDTGREHNCIVVTARGQAFEEGVVLDAWRCSGRLWHGPVKKDKYPWEPLPPDRTPEALKHLVSK